jgi:hypothetical protein
VRPVWRHWKFTILDLCDIDNWRTPFNNDYPQLFRFHYLLQKAGKRTPDDPTQCHKDSALASALKHAAQDLNPRQWF